MTKTRLLLLKLAVSGALIAWLYARVPLADIRELLAQLDLRILSLSFGLLLVVTAVGSFKWYVLLAADGMDVSYPRAFAAYWSGIFFSAFLPSTIGGDVYRVYHIGGRTDRHIPTLASVVADRLLGFLAVGCMSIVAAIAGHRMFAPTTLLLIPIAVCAGIAGVIWALFHQGHVQRLFTAEFFSRHKRFRERIATFFDSFNAYRAKPRTMATALILSLLFQSVMVVFVYSLSCALGLPAPFTSFCIFVPLIILIEAIPITISGIGLRDAAYVIFFTQVGLTRVEAQAIPLLLLGVTLAYALCGGLVFLVKGGSRPPSARD